MKSSTQKFYSWTSRKWFKEKWSQSNEWPQQQNRGNLHVPFFRVLREQSVNIGPPNQQHVEFRKMSLGSFIAVKDSEPRMACFVNFIFFFGDKVSTWPWVLGCSGAHCRPGLELTERPAGFFLPHPGNKGLCHHTLPFLFLLLIFFF